MRKDKDLTGQKFGKLTILSRAEDKIYHDDLGKITRKRLVWNCICDCGKQKKVVNDNLMNGLKSCGCSAYSYKMVFKPGDKIGDLTTVSFNSGKWLCICSCGKQLYCTTSSLNNKKSCGCLTRRFKDDFLENEYRSLCAGKTYNELTTISSSDNDMWLCNCSCGKLTYIKGSILVSNKKKSCGCLTNKKRSDKEKSEIGLRSRKYSFEDGCVYAVLNSYKTRAKRKNFGFDLTVDFIKTEGTKNCYYCGAKPGLVSDLYERLCDVGKENKPFIYNGFDRKDSSIGYVKSNVLPACTLCNRSKSNKHVDTFIKWALSMECKTFDQNYLSTINLIDLPKNKKLETVRIIHKKYNDGDLSIKEFYSLANLPCYYCDTEYSNNYNYYVSKNNKELGAECRKLKEYRDPEQGYFKYNGIDRIDSNFTHNKNNVVPCCKQCNWSKMNLSLVEFNDWITRIKKFQHGKN